MRRLGWGIIGIGNIVKSAIAPAMTALDNCEIVAAVSRDRDRAEAFATQFEAGHAYTDYSEMLDNPEVDAVFVATPNSQHSGQVVAAARAGKHVLCDKPLATNRDDAIAAVEACEEAGVRLGTNFHNRHLPWARDTRRLIAEGSIGEVELVQAEVSSGPRTYDNWRADPDLAGLGSLFNVGVHILDVLGWLLDSNPSEVSSFFDEAPGSGSVEMLAMTMIRFESGAVAYVNSNERILLPQNDISFYGSAGRIDGVSLTRSNLDGELRVTTPDGTSVTPYPSPGAHRLALEAFTEAVLDGREPNASGVDGLRSVELCEAISTSARTGRVAPVSFSR